MTDEERAVLDFESRFYVHGGRKVVAIHAELGMTATQYAQRLNRLVDDPEALRYAPMTVHRLERRRAAGLRARRAS